jgi:excisionase family DNA binding protein
METVTITMEAKDFKTLISTTISDELRKAGIGEDKISEMLKTPKEACAILRISLRKLRRITGSGEIKAYKVGGSIRYKESELFELTIAK